MFVVITGKIGSGKSTALEIFQMLGAGVIDADQVVHEFYDQPSSEIVELLRKEFGEKIIDDDTINRPVLRNIVLQQAEKLNKLNALVHPFLSEEIDRRLLDFPKDRIVALEVALFEKISLKKKPNKIILIRSSLENCLERMNDYGWQPAETKKIWHLQKEYKSPNITIENNESPIEFDQKIQAEFGKLLSLASY